MDNLREQFIERFAHELFRRTGSGFVLKGGGAMRALFGGQRLTKDIDLDFTNPKRTAESLHKTILRVVRTAARGLPELRDLQVSEPGKVEMNPRWKVNFIDNQGRRYHVEIEVSRDPERAPPGPVVQHVFIPEAAKGIPRFWVDIYEGPVLIATKLAALLGREVPRDVYDLDLLKHSAATPGPKLVAWAVKRAGIKAAPAKVLWSHLDGLSWKRFQSELYDSLPAEVTERIDEAEWTAMKLRVGEYAERLLVKGKAGAR